MSDTTLQQKFRTVLLNVDYVEIPTRTRKAVTLRNKQTGTLIFLGKCGSVRMGDSYSKSYPVSAAKVKQLMEMYSKIEGKV